MGLKGWIFISFNFSYLLHILERSFNYRAWFLTVAVAAMLHNPPRMSILTADTRSLELCESNWEKSPARATDDHEERLFAPASPLHAYCICIICDCVPRNLYSIRELCPLLGLFSAVAAVAVTEAEKSKNKNRKKEKWIRKKKSRGRKGAGVKGGEELSNGGGRDEEKKEENEVYVESLCTWFVCVCVFVHRSRLALSFSLFLDPSSFSELPEIASLLPLRDKKTALTINVGIYVSRVVLATVANANGTLSDYRFYTLSRQHVNVTNTL